MPTPAEDQEADDAFHQWCLTAPSAVMMDDHPLPLLTVLLHLCGNDERKFEEATKILRAAFLAGAASH